MGPALRVKKKQLWQPRLKGRLIKPSQVTQVVKNLPAKAGDVEFNSWVRKTPQRRKWQPTPIFLPGGIPWTEEPGGLQSTGSQKVRHN